MVPVFPAVVIFESFACFPEPFSTAVLSISVKMYAVCGSVISLLIFLFSKIISPLEFSILVKNIGLD